MEQFEEECWDDVNGRRLKPEKVRGARKAELKYFDKMGVGELAPIKECWNRTGKPPVTVRWIDHDKGTNGAEVYRSRLVARQFRGMSNRSSRRRRHWTHSNFYYR